MSLRWATAAPRLRFFGALHTYHLVDEVAACASTACRQRR